jgi:N-acetylmuramoyl-L-alanine amidase
MIINEQLLKYNRSYKPLSPQGVVVHSTATPGATAQQEYMYFNSGYKGASAHYFVDWIEILRVIPENEIAWHAGRTANSRFLAVEAWGPSGYAPKHFALVWTNLINLLVDICTRYNWTSEQIWSHKGVSELWHETDHVDPYPYFNKYGKTWQNLLDAVDLRLKGGTRKVKNLVVYQGEADKRAAEYLADYLQCPICHMNNLTDETLQAVENVYQVGGSLRIQKATLIAGSDRFDTLKEVLKKIGRV